MKQELRTIAALGGGVLLVGFCLLGFTLGWIAAGQWLFQAGLLWSYVCRCVRRRLPLNRAGDAAPLYAGLGWGNRLTILRGGLIALAGGFLFMDQNTVLNVWVPAISYTLAAILDRLDGFVARRSRQVSLLGNELDIRFDALGLVIAPLLAIGLGKLHWSFLLLSAAYYFYQWGLQRRLSLGLLLYPLPPNPLRRTLAGFQMGFIAVALWPLLNPAFTIIAGAAFMLPVLLGFVMDWWVVCGRLSSKSYYRLEAWSERHFQPGLRALLVLLLFPATRDFGLSELAYVWLVLCACLILCGVAGRLGALTMITLLGRYYPESSVDWSGQLLIFAASWILLLGTGRYSLRQCGDEWSKRYDGA